MRRSGLWHLGKLGEVSWRRNLAEKVAGESLAKKLEEIARGMTGPLEESLPNDREPEPLERPDGQPEEQAGEQLHKWRVSGL